VILATKVFAVQIFEYKVLIKTLWRPQLPYGYSYN